MSGTGRRTWPMPTWWLSRRQCGRTTRRVWRGGGNAKRGQGRYVVAEADESDGSFLHLPATFGIVTNIDNDHMDHFGTMENLDLAFRQFVGKLPFYGMAAVCGEDLGVRR